MIITPTTYSIAAVVSGFQDDAERGVRGLDGGLDIRPAYQREFVYDQKQQTAVIDTVMRSLPLNTMYWVRSIDADTGEERFEVLDGQQRTISICRFVTGGFSIADRHGAIATFAGLPADVQKKILDYELQVYVCEGSDSERLEWFRTINVAGEKLTEQELRNANYPGRWLSDAKRFFSRPGGPADDISSGLVRASAIRQELLEKALAWISANQGLGDLTEYMALHAGDANASELKTYWRTLTEWVDQYFLPASGLRDKPMLGVDWGRLYNEHGGRRDLDQDQIRAEVARLMADGEVQKKSGIYEYVLRGSGLDAQSLRLLSLRAFSESDKATMYAAQDGRCAAPQWTGHDPDEHFERAGMHADHVIPWSKGGRTELPNGQMLCAACNLEKKDKVGY
ncbi:DUF262 domain-containing protein [Brachybacterium sp. JHP9]|uniref:DUF262 domain-containing protein n=1 Tax=Brachybacterium equifaecis TaxID=2910770 RepID=A0ABT0R1Q5_9MICO|nr:DUF262 domain-containing protein [Brachybacterium equifaecis]MCL6423684.1 DUF262 domain-containing protein [Brachybacterium equifaecis]